MTRLLVATVLAGALVAAGHAQNQSPNTGSIIRGRVVSAYSGEALPHVRIDIYQDALPLPPIFTDGQGEFASPPLAPGRYRLTARKSGYTQAAVNPINLNSQEALTVRLPRAASISGRVVDGFGEPAAAVIVFLLGSRPEAPLSAAPPGPQTQSRTARIFNSALKRVTTDDLGEYRFGGLPEGAYFVMVQTQTPSVAQYVEVQQIYFPGVSTPVEAQPIVVHPADERTGIDFTGIPTQLNEFTSFSQITSQNNIVIVGPGNTPTMPRRIIGNGTIRGTVTRTDGLPLAHASVSTRVLGTLAGMPGNRPMNWMVHTDETGRYEFTELPPGRYRITAAKLGYTSTVYGQKPDDATSVRNQPQGTQIELAEGQITTRVDITMPRYSAVSGRLLDDFGDPVEGVSVSISEIKFETGRRRLVGAPGIVARSTDDLGRFRLYGLLPGQYVVNAAPGQVAPNELPSNLSGYAPTYFPGTTSAREAQLVPVPRSQDVSGVDFTLVPTPTASISGVKIGSDGEPLGGSLMLMESQRSGALITPAAGARIKDDGSFEFPNVAPGDYVIQADRGRFDGSAEGDFAWQYVTMNGTSVAGLELRSPPGSTIRGRVVFDGDGPPPKLRNLAIVPERADLDRTPNRGSIARASVRDDLTFEITGVHGPRRIGTDNRTVSGWGLKAVVANGVDVTDMPLTFGTPDQSLSDVQVVLTNRLTDVFVTAVDSRGEPTREYNVLVFPDDREKWYPGSRYFRRAAPQPQGYASVTGLPPGQYHVAAVTNAGVLRDGVDAWQDPDFLESILQRSTTETLTEGAKISVSAKVITP